MKKKEIIMISVVGILIIMILIIIVLTNKSKQELINKQTTTQEEKNIEINYEYDYYATKEEQDNKTVYKYTIKKVESDNINEESIYSYTCKNKECFSLFANDEILIDDGNQELLYCVNGKKVKNCTNDFVSYEKHIVKNDDFNEEIYLINHKKKVSIFLHKNTSESWIKMIDNNRERYEDGNFTLNLPVQMGEKENILFINYNSKEDNQSYSKLCVYNFKTKELSNVIDRKKITPYGNDIFDYCEKLGDFYLLHDHDECNINYYILDKNFNYLNKGWQGDGGELEDYFRLNKDGSLSILKGKKLIVYENSTKNYKIRNTNLEKSEILDYAFLQNSTEYFYLIVSKNNNIYSYNVDTEEYKKLDISNDSIIKSNNGLEQYKIVVNKLLKKYNELDPYDEKEFHLGECNSFLNSNKEQLNTCLSKCNYYYNFLVEEDGSLNISNHYYCE